MVKKAGNRSLLPFAAYMFLLRMFIIITNRAMMIDASPTVQKSIVLMILHTVAMRGTSEGSDEAENIIKETAIAEILQTAQPITAGDILSPRLAFVNMQYELTKKDGLAMT